MAGGCGFEPAHKLGGEQELGDAEENADEQMPGFGAHVHFLNEELVYVEGVAGYVAYSIALQIGSIEQQVARVEEEDLEGAGGADAWWQEWRAC